MSNTLKHTRTVSLQTLKNAYQKTKNSDFGQGLVLASGAFGFVLASAKINGKLDQKPTETFNNQREYSSPQKSTIPQILHRSWVSDFLYQISIYKSLYAIYIVSIKFKNLLLYFIRISKLKYQQKSGV